MNKTDNTGAPIDTADDTYPNHPTLIIDWQRYEAMLEASDLPDADKRAFLETLWSIVVSFVDLGIGIHPFQQLDPDGCELDIDLTRFMATDVVSSLKYHSQSHFTDAADPPKGKAKKKEDIKL